LSNFGTDLDDLFSHFLMIINGNTLEEVFDRREEDLLPSLGDLGGDTSFEDNFFERVGACFDDFFDFFGDLGGDLAFFVLDLDCFLVNDFSFGS
jgi:hypothetical protein